MRFGGSAKILERLCLVMAAVFFSVFFLSLFNMPAGMDMSGKMSGCPFMSHEEVICSMGILDHLEAWESVFTITVPQVILLLLMVTALVVVFSVAPNLLFKQRYRELPLTRNIRELTYAFSYRPLQELFSNGILHPKLF